MTVENLVTAQEIGRSFANAVRNDPVARRLWVLAGPDHVELWLLVEPNDMEIDRRLYGASRPL